MHYIQLNSLKFPKKIFLLMEIIGIFILVPMLMYFWTPKLILPILWFFAFLCWGILHQDKTFDRVSFWRISALHNHKKEILVQFVIITFLLWVMVYFFVPELLFSLLKQNLLLWLLILFLYPILSVYPQELIYRTFFFHRYGSFFKNRKFFILLNGLLFGYLHIIFHNWVAVFLTIGGGILFAWMYERTTSTALVFVVHALYGCMLFTLGLGQFFYNGTLFIFTL